MAEFSIFITDFCCRMETLPYFWKYYHKNERHLCLVRQSFTKLPQNVCLNNSHILIYWYARCDYKLWNAPRFYCVFWIFSYIIDEHSFLKHYIFNKLSQIVWLINVHILVCQRVKCDCSLWKVLLFNSYFWEIFIYYTCLKRYNFFKLLQIVF